MAGFLADEAFDNIPALGVISILRRQSPQAMQMIGEEDKGFNGEWVSLLYSANALL